MAVPYFTNTGFSVYVYFKNAMIIPYPVDYERPQSIGRAEDLKIKCYDHGLGGTHKRTWRLKAYMSESASSNYKFSNWLAFVTSTIIYAKYKFWYYDKDGIGSVVRLVEWSEKIISKTEHEVNIVIEEDYA